jgi:hypothetical protein
MFKFRCNIFIGVRIIKEMPGSVASGTFYITMHGPMNIKFINAKQAKETYQYRNIKGKLYKTNAAIWYNKLGIEKMNNLTNRCISLVLLWEYKKGLSLSGE